MAEPVYFIRPAQDDDVPFITSNWLKTYRRGGAAVKRVHNGIFFDEQHNLICDLIERSRVFLAVATHDENQLLGFCCCGTSRDGDLVVHYVYVKESLRRFGVARQLLECAKLAQGLDRQCGVIATHYTRAWEETPWGDSANYNPYLAWRIGA